MGTAAAGRRAGRKGRGSLIKMFFGRDERFRELNSYPATVQSDPEEQSVRFHWPRYLFRTGRRAARNGSSRGVERPRRSARWIFLVKRNERFPREVTLDRHCLLLRGDAVSSYRFVVIAAHGRVPGASSRD